MDENHEQNEEDAPPEQLLAIPADDDGDGMNVVDWNVGFIIDNDYDGDVDVDVDGAMDAMDDDDNSSSSDEDDIDANHMGRMDEEISDMEEAAANNSESELDEYYFSDDTNGCLFRDVLNESVVENSRNILFSILRLRHGLSAKKPPYAFQPLRLIRCNYKLICPVFNFPTARSGHRIVANESYLYCLGGYNPHIPVNGNSVLFQELWSFNFANNKWKCVMKANDDTNMPAELASNALIMHNNVLISYGGTGYPFGEQCSNDCNVYTTGKEPIVSRLEVSGNLPTAQYGPAIVIHDNYLYTIGGTTGFDYSCDVYRMDLKTKVWENLYNCRPEMRDDPEGRYRHEVVYDGEHIYVLGGGTSMTVFDLQKIPAFNLKTNTWIFYDTLPDRSIQPAHVEQGDTDIGYPKARKCFSCVQHKLPNGDVEAFITGGLQSLLQVDYTTYFSDVWKLNLRTKQWTWIRTAPLPKPLYFHSAADNGQGCMYIFGGIEYSSKLMRRRNDLFKMWMTIPKLSEICWEALNYYNIYLERIGAKNLLKIGVPKRFVERLK